jgi:hypothetical protein
MRLGDRRRSRWCMLCRSHFRLKLIVMLGFVLSR